MAKEDVNEVRLKGRAGKDAEVRFTSGGKQLVKFSLATGGGKSKDGSKEYPTDWHNVEMWDVAGSENVRKGELVEVEGRIKYDSWEDRTTGQKKYMTKIIAYKMGGQSQPQPEKQSTPAPLTPRNYQEQPITDDDIPF